MIWQKEWSPSSMQHSTRRRCDDDAITLMPNGAFFKLIWIGLVDSVLSELPGKTPEILYIVEV